MSKMSNRVIHYVINLLCLSNEQQEDKHGSEIRSFYRNNDIEIGGIIPNPHCDWRGLIVIFHSYKILNLNFGPLKLHLHLAVRPFTVYSNGYACRIIRFILWPLHPPSSTPWKAGFNLLTTPDSIRKQRCPTSSTILEMSLYCWLK